MTVLVSSRVNTFQEAYQLGSLVVLPVVFLMLGQVSGLVFLEVRILLVLGLVLYGVGYLVLFRTNRSARENVLFLIMMYVIGAGWGLILSAFGL